MAWKMPSMTMMTPAKAIHPVQAERSEPPVCCVERCSLGSIDDMGEMDMRDLLWT